MTTPTEKDVLNAMAEKLRGGGVDEAVITAVTGAYEGATLPNAEQFLALLRTTSQGEEAAQ